MTKEFDDTKYSYNLDAENFQILYKQYKDALKMIKNLKEENEQLKLENELLERDLHYCAKQFKEDIKNILLDLKGGLND